MKGTFNQGWWSCFESFATELLFVNKSLGETICARTLDGAGITKKDASLWLGAPIKRNPRVRQVVGYPREY